MLDKLRPVKKHNISINDDWVLIKTFDASLMLSLNNLKEYSTTKSSVEMWPIGALYKKDIYYYILLYSTQPPKVRSMGLTNPVWTMYSNNFNGKLEGKHGF